MTIVVTFDQIVMVVFVVFWVIQMIVNVLKRKKNKLQALLVWALSITAASFLFSVFCSQVVLYRDHHRTEKAQFEAMVAAILEEWKPIMLILESEELRPPAKMLLVRNNVQENIYPDLTISQQNYLVESTFECSICGCSVDCNKLRDELSEILAMWVNPFAIVKG